MSVSLTFYRSNSGKLYYSSDKKNFTQITTIPFSNISGYCYNNVTKEIWCVYNSSSISYAYVSTDLSNWSMKTLPFANVAGIIYAEGRGELVVFQNFTRSSGSSSQIAVSTDNGTTWTSKTTLSASGSYGPFNGLRYLPDEDTYVKDQPDRTNQWYYSDDLITWTLVTTSVSGDRGINGFSSINFDQYDDGYYCGGNYWISSNSYRPILYKITSMKTGEKTAIWSTSSIASPNVRSWDKPMKYNNFIIWFWPYYVNNYTITAVVYDLNTNTINTSYSAFVEPESRQTGCTINGINGATIFFSTSIGVIMDLRISDFTLTNVNDFQITGTTTIASIGGYDSLMFDNPISIGKNILKFNGQKVIKINNQRVSKFNSEFIFPPKEPVASGYQVTFTFNESSKEYKTHLNIYDGQDTTGTLLFSDTNVGIATPTTTVTCTSGYLCVDFDNGGANGSASITSGTITETSTWPFVFSVGSDGAITFTIDYDF